MIRKDTCQTSVGLLDAGKEVTRSQVTYSRAGGEENNQRSERGGRAERRRQRNGWNSYLLMLQA